MIGEKSCELQINAGLTLYLLRIFAGTFLCTIALFQTLTFFFTEDTGNHFPFAIFLCTLAVSSIVWKCMLRGESWNGGGVLFLK